MSFFAELKRRNVLRVAVAYLVLSWLLVQVGSVLLPTFHAPGWVMQDPVAHAMMDEPFRRYRDPLFRGVE